VFAVSCNALPEKAFAQTPDTTNDVDTPVANDAPTALEADPSQPQATPNPAADAPPSENLETIIVSAGKQRENIQRVPFSVFVATASTLERARIRDFDDLPRIDPSLTITKTTQPGNNSVNIRGIGTYAYSIATEPSVAVVVDDVPQAFQAAAFAALVDVQQVEVLRGPQNTLYGKSASAGVVNITTQPVSDALTGRIDALGTDDGEQRLQGMLSGPITETLGFRLTGNHSDYRGTVFNLATDNWLNGQEDTTFRGKLEWRPTSDLTLTLSSFGTRTDASCCTSAETFVALNSTTGSAATGPARIPASVFLAGITPSPENRVLRMDVDAQGNARDTGAGLNVAVRLGGGFTLKSITSSDRYHLDDRQDTDSTDVNFAAFQPISPPGGSANGGYFDIDSRTQEVRLNSPDEGRLRYVASVYYGDTRSQRYFVRGSNTLDDYSTATPAGNPGAPAAPSSLPTTNGTAYSRYLSQARATNYAIFGEGSFALTDRLDVLAGLRLNREEISYVFFDEGNNVVFGDPDCSTATPSGTSIQTCNDDDAVTGRAGLRYRFTPRFMAFATYSRGYKGMAYDLSSTLTTRSAAPASSRFPGRPLADVVAANQPVPPETVDNYEIGFKSSFLGGGLMFNVTAFDMTFEGFQAQSRDLLLNQNLLNSIGRVTSRGVETELAGTFGHLSLSAAAAYDRAIMDDFPNASCYQGQTAAEGCVGGVQDLSGKPLFNAPKWNFNLNAQYDLRINATLTSFITLGYRRQSEVIFNLLQDPASLQPAYGIADFAAGLRTDRWRLTVFASNVLDQSYALTAGRDAQVNNPPGVFATSWKPAREAARYVGTRFSYQF